jgi:putative redox protein
MMLEQQREPMEGVEVHDTGAGRFQVEIRTAGARLIADEPVSAGGLGSGPTPYDLLGSALGACTAMTVSLYAERKGWPLKSVAVRVLHRSGGLQTRDRFAREIVLEGDLSGEQRHRLLEIAERCPVHQTLDRGADVITILAETPLPDRRDPIPVEHAKDMAAACQD